MKRYDKTTQMIGQMIGPVADESNPQPIMPCYRLKTLLGKQTGRRTFLAIDTRTHRQVVIKLLLFGPDFTWEDLKLFEREAETLKSLDHPAIPKYLDSFEVETALGAGFVLVQTHIEARSLQSWVTAGRRFSEQELIEIAQALLKILRYLHSQCPAVVHRDIKPSNILLGAQNSSPLAHVYLVDFGSVQTVHYSGTMTVVGTYGYMPPEQFGGRAQPASDLYSLGATLIYLATGQHPADLTQDNLQIEFSRYVGLSPAFSTWIRQLTYADLSKRIPSALQAFQQLTHPPLIKAPANPKVTATPKATANPKVPGNVHRHETLSLSPTINNFKVSSTTKELEIQLPPSRAKRNLTITSKGSRRSIFSAIFLATLVPAVLILMRLWLLITAAVLIPCVLALQEKPKRRTQSIKPSSIRLWVPARGPLQLSMTTASERNRGGEIGKVISKIIGRPTHASKHDAQLSQLALRAITTNFHNDRLDFHFTDSNRDGRLSIRGSQSEIRWLCQHLAQWKDIPIDGFRDRP